MQKERASPRDNIKKLRKQSCKLASPSVHSLPWCAHSCYLNCWQRLGLVFGDLHNFMLDNSSIFSHEWNRKWRESGPSKLRWIQKSGLSFVILFRKTRRRLDAGSVYLGPRSHILMWTFWTMSFDSFNLSVAFFYPVQNSWMKSHTRIPQVEKYNSV